MLILRILQIFNIPRKPKMKNVGIVRIQRTRNSIFYANCSFMPHTSHFMPPFNSPVTPRWDLPHCVKTCFENNYSAVCLWPSSRLLTPAPAQLAVSPIFYCFFKSPTCNWRGFSILLLLAALPVVTALMYVLSGSFWKAMTCTFP